ncbi:MAG: response regulator [Pseudodesulfovibrio sp.]|uniref:Response regulator receiver n=1 Tax=Pseudodesulfovibrio aespoeensis (strain ATCC 700646 / DSM 10631 / Aspo-2) TaxID=643562 RepID=E6VSN1_PSEA9|nr:MULTISPECIES: response regulator [Pseudodesulfovibrio]MBU4474659.1 response regulator [Pseudomonadota bacterium]ADU62016.1 response regulator receiver [Pseudodesulfovibrio aespoeensis Aspo-2]MBU4516014.1 response regulator [Pseudomonadota bacterium]MBU4522784.1 response regulator [Pseudomonadota bacterium]MBU4559908.1 response regulator [Pseudomonadota bacterium]
MRTLIVEDTLINQEFLRMIMSAWGECHVADCGERAVDVFAGALEVAPFDIVLMDVMLPGIDGLQTLERIRALEQSRGILPGDGIKAIITTALDEADRAAQLRDHGFAVSCLAKPVRQDAVERELRKFGLIG